jgi:subtilisin family serine protease
VFSGLTIESKTDNVDSLLSIEGVVNVWPLRSVPMAPLAKRRKLSGNMKHPNTSAHHWTGVNKLHKAGIRGKGATVAVIDTGIDYTHKAVGTHNSTLVLLISNESCSLVDALGLGARSLEDTTLLGQTVSDGACARKTTARLTC